MRRLFFTLYHKKKIRGHETLTDTFTKRIEDKANQNDNKKLARRTQLKRRDKKNTSYPLVLI